MIDEDRGEHYGRCVCKARAVMKISNRFRLTTLAESWSLPDIACEVVILNLTQTLVEFTEIIMV